MALCPDAQDVLCRTSAKRILQAVVMTAARRIILIVNYNN